MKKLLLLLSAIVVFACFVSCGNNEEPSDLVPEEYDFVLEWGESNRYDSIKNELTTYNKSTTIDETKYKKAR